MPMTGNITGTTVVQLYSNNSGKLSEPLKKSVDYCSATMESWIVFSGLILMAPHRHLVELYRFILWGERAAVAAVR